MTTLADLMVASLGEPRHDSPLAAYVADRATNEHYVEEDDRGIFPDTGAGLAGTAPEAPAPRTLPPHELPSFEPGGPRRRLFFEPGATRVAIVTCGGLCPGLNN